MTRYSVLALITLLSPTAAFANPNTLPDITIPFEKHILSNGLQLIVHEDHKSPIVAVNVWYQVGSRYEKQGRTGLAHLVEHLMFNGSEVAGSDYIHALEAVGATKINGTTDRDRTNYFQNVPASALDLVLWMEADRMGSLLSTIDQERLDEQRNVVLNEKRQSEDRPFGAIDRIIAANTYPTTHPYSWLPIGSTEDLRNISLEDVRNWTSTYYGAANAIIVVAGAVKSEVVKKKVQEYFGHIPAGRVLNRTTSQPAKMSEKSRMSMYDKVPHARLYKVWNMPGIASQEFPHLNLAAHILAGGKTSRLYQRLIYRDKLATDVKATTSPLELGSQLEIVVDVANASDLRSAENIVDEEMALFMNDGPTSLELERSKTHAYAKYVRQFERLDGFGGKSDILAEGQAYSGNPDHYRTYLRQIRGATPAVVRDAAVEWLSDGSFALEVYPTPEYRTVESSFNRGKWPNVEPPETFTLPSMKESVLPNGLKIAVVERRGAPIVQIELIVKAGFASDMHAKPGTAKLALSAMSDGTTRWSAAQIAARAEDIGTQFRAHSTLNSSQLSVSSLSNRLAESLEPLAEVLLNPRFSPEDVARLKAQTLASIRYQKAQPEDIPSRLFPKLIFGENHAYSNPMLGHGYEETVASIQADDLREFYSKWMRPDNATLLIVGDTSLEEVVPIAKERLQQWRLPRTPLPTIRYEKVPVIREPRIFLVHRPESQQSVIMAGYPGPARSDPHYAELMVLNALVGGNFSSRLNMKLREEKRWSYGASTALLDVPGPAPFVISTAVQTDKTSEALFEIQKELTGLLGEGKPKGDEVRFAAGSLARALGSKETVDEIAGLYRTILLHDLSDDYWNSLSRVLGSMNAAQLNTAVSKLIRPRSLTWIIVGDTTKIEADIRRLGIGEVIVMTLDGDIMW